MVYTQTMNRWILCFLKRCPLFTKFFKFSLNLSHLITHFLLLPDFFLFKVLFTPFKALLFPLERFNLTFNLVFFSSNIIHSPLHLLCFSFDLSLLPYSLNLHLYSLLILLIPVPLKLFPLLLKLVGNFLKLVLFFKELLLSHSKFHLVIFKADSVFFIYALFDFLLVLNSPVHFFDNCFAHMHLLYHAHYSTSCSLLSLDHRN
jgi:hypothetical protein